jgi:ATP-binding cassette subfamily B multidrug efflux pump
VSDQFFEDDALGKAYDSHLMKRLLQYLRPYKKWLIIALVILIVSTLLRLAGPVVIKMAIDDYIAVGDSEGLGRLVLLYAAILLVQFFATWGQIYLMEWIGQKAMYDLRMKVFKHIQGLTMDFYDRNPVGRVITRVTSDINSLNELFSSGVVNIIGSSPQFYSGSKSGVPTATSGG